MKLKTHSIQEPTWRQSTYGEPVATYGTASSISMMIAWNALTEQDANYAKFRQYELVGLTKANPAVGSLIDGEYVVGYVEEGRWNRVFMRHAEGKDRTYVE